jgi:ElaB/YqjD/DUF883 family membrane-anchored ribosome-binding protein
MRVRLGLAVLLLVVLPGCRAAKEKYYDSLEKVGLERRELLVSRVDKAREAQKDAQEQFEDALEQFQAVVGYTGGDLEKMYDKLSSEYEASARRAEEVRERIRKVEEVARSLFEEWKTEIGQYRDPALRRESEAKLAATRRRYDQLLVVMKRSAEPMEPVLARLHDQVLYLKHNLNARALGSLQGTAQALEADVTRLVAEIETSIAEADAFIREMRAEK